MNELISDYINLTNLAFMAKYPVMCWSAVFALVAVSAFGITKRLKEKR